MIKRIGDKVSLARLTVIAALVFMALRPAHAASIVDYPHPTDEEVTAWTTKNGYDGVPTTKKECDEILDVEGVPDVAYLSCVRRIPRTASPARVTVQPPYHAQADNVREGWKTQCAKGDQDACRELCHEPEDNCNIEGKPPTRVTVAPPYQGPPPIGWVYAPYTQCANFPQCSVGMVNVQADGLNVRTIPNGPPVMAVVNGTPLLPVRREGNWLLVAPACDLTPTWAWSWNAGVPLNRCWVYF